MSRAPTLALLLAACAGPGVAPSDCDSAAFDGGTLVFSAITQAFDAGTLTVVDLTEDRVCDGITAATGDTVVATAAGEVIQIDRGVGALRWLTPGAWDAPVLERSVGSNPHDVIACGEGWLVSLYEEAYLLHLDARGRELGRLDLSEHADADGLPEASQLARRQGRVLLTLQRLDRLTDPAFWQPAGPGAVLEVACDPLRIVDAHTVGENPQILPTRTDELVLVDQGGAVEHLSAAGERTVRARLDRPAVGGAFAEGGHGVILTRDTDLWHRITCVDPAGDTRPLLTTDAYLPDAHPLPDGTIAVAVRSGWASPDDAPSDATVVLGPSPSIWRVDPVACEVVAELSTALGPFDLDLY